ncbi:MAG: hypothetical protein GY760_17025 [Deltaproteobacteria bacterium]|nr:hypothetical protein [Deltaproteobacteria bacterium]
MRKILILWAKKKILNQLKVSDCVELLKLWCELEEIEKSNDSLLALDQKIILYKIKNILKAPISLNNLSELYTELLTKLFADDVLNDKEKNKSISKSHRPYNDELEKFYSLKYQAIAHGGLKISEIDDLTLEDWYFHIKEMIIQNREQYYEIHTNKNMDYRTNKEIDLEHKLSKDFADEILNNL